MAKKSEPVRIRAGVRARLYIDEWFEYRGLNDEKVSGRLGIDRSTVWKWRKYPNRLDPGKLSQLASALDCEPADLWRNPHQVSLDSIVRDADDELRATIADVVTRLAARR